MTYGDQIVHISVWNALEDIRYPYLPLLDFKCVQ